MAYMNQEKKAKIAEALKKVVPKGWKYTLSVHNHSTLNMTIKSAPVDILEAMYQHYLKNPTHAGRYQEVKKQTYVDVNPYWVSHQFDGELLKIFQKIIAAMNEGNWNNSDSMSDYVDIGWYIGIGIGRWDKPFEVK